jgi:hypothetical protein
VTFNGKVLEDARIEHADLMAGGDLVFYVSNKKSHPGTKTVPHWDQNSPTLGLNRPLRENSLSVTPSLRGNISFTLNRQHRTWPLTFGWAGDTLTVTCKLSHASDVKVVPEHIGISFHTDVLTEESISVPIQCINLPDGKVLRTFPAKIKVHFVAGVSRIRTLKPEDFSVIADYQEITQNPSDKCTLYLQKIPEGISRATLSSKQVDYLIEEE